MYCGTSLVITLYRQSINGINAVNYTITIAVADQQRCILSMFFFFFRNFSLTCIVPQLFSSLIPTAGNCTIKCSLKNHLTYITNKCLVWCDCLKHDLIDVILFSFIMCQYDSFFSLLEIISRSRLKIWTILAVILIVFYCSCTTRRL